VTKIIVAGAGGRMGRTILKLAHGDPGIKIVGAFEHPKSSVLGRDVGELIGERALQVPVHMDVRECIRAGDVLVDFTEPAATAQNLKAALDYRKALVIGTTGLGPAILRKIRDAAKKIAIVQSPNMSLGVNLLFSLVRSAASVLDDSYDVEIVEAHHRAKRDAPSGTALALGRHAAEARKVFFEANAVYGRSPASEPRKKGTIGFHAVRGGDIVGEHTVSFIADGERVELTHRASAREAFARGALLAAKFAARKRSGLYDMRQVLGLN
jgi:4-hydroxy-tetrahydrodipicolinate reductase